ncbi:MAG: ribonuclease III [Lachnospiraceae bacterium]|nr:ribonuclease III [Lachnospiraceae bacterium]
MNAALLKEYFDLPDQDIRTYSPLTLAFLGDNVFDLLIRSILVQQGNRSANHLHRDKSRLVKAETQAKILDAIRKELTPEEEAVCRRGRNAKSYSMPKHAKMSDYRKATGLEALYGYLYLQGDSERILSLTQKGLLAIGMPGEKMPDHLKTEE